MARTPPPAGEIDEKRAAMLKISGLGLIVGDAVSSEKLGGEVTWASVGETVGESVSPWSVGAFEGASEGETDGAPAWSSVGTLVGALVGGGVGESLGELVGPFVSSISTTMKELEPKYVLTHS